MVTVARGTPALLVAAVLVSVSLAGLAAAARTTSDAVPQRLVGKWGRTITRANWERYGLDHPAASVKIDVDRTGQRVGFYGHNVSYPDWYTDFTVTGTKLAIGQLPVCGGKGRYTWKLVGTRLTITRVADACKDRIAVFAGIWKKK